MWVEFMRASNLMVAEMWKLTLEGEGLPTKLFPANGDIMSWSERQPFLVLVPKGRESMEAWFALEETREALERVNPWAAAELEQACRSLATPSGTGWKTRELFMTLRVVLTGRQESPPLFDMLVVLGRSR